MLRKRDKGSQTAVRALKDNFTQTDNPSAGSYYRDEDNVTTYWRLKNEILATKDKTIQFCQDKGLIKRDGELYCDKCGGVMKLKKDSKNLFTEFISTWWYPHLLRNILRKRYHIDDYQ